MTTTTQLPGRPAEPRWGRRVAIVAVLCIAATGCNSGGTATGTPGPTPDTTLRGGTLRVAASALADHSFALSVENEILGVLDPQVGVAETNELFRCCLLRTLLSHRGTTTDKDSAELLPDLATGLPEVSGDGLTWTFHLRPGIRYGPPLQGTEVKAADIVRALERSAALPTGGPTGGAQGPSVFSGIIDGYDKFAAGTRDTISGLETPDSHTLVVHVTARFGDLGERFTFPFTAPIPPLPGDTQARLGVATGHDIGDGPFLVSTGPYMIEGIGQVDFTKPPSAQRPPAGYVGDKSYTLVRNPSWSPSLDPLRPAFVDRIEIYTGMTNEAAAVGIENGTYDLLLVNKPPPQPPAELIARFRLDPKLGTIETDSRDSVDSLEMNVGVPPFDDPHVRRAVAYAIDRQHVLDLRGSRDAALIGHVVPDSMEQGALVGFDPFSSTGHHGDLGAAQSEVSQSRYDTHHDGTCGAAVCKHVLTLIHANNIHHPADEKIAALIISDVAKIGIVLDAQTYPAGEFFGRLADHAQRIAVAFGIGGASGGGSLFNASNVFEGELGGAAYGGPSDTLVGAAPDDLRTWGYSATSVPAIDDRIGECLAYIGSQQVRCWTELDVYATENIVAEVPLLSYNYISVIPKRVVRFSYDQSMSMPAFDQVAVAH